MSTKRLQKTVIEGGRYGSNKWSRRNSHVENRAKAREFCKRIAQDPELVEELDIEPIQWVGKEFKDKLSPMYCWLDSHVGQPWAEVHSKVFKIFDTRTTAGRHITFDHLLREVVDTKTGFDSRGILSNPTEDDILGKHRPWYYGIHDYYVDEAGLLKKADKSYKKRYKRITEEEYIVAGKWLNGRIISEKGGILYWHSPSEGLWKSSWIDPNGDHVDQYKMKSLNYYLFSNGHHDIVNKLKLPSRELFFTFSSKTHSDYWEMIENPFSFRQRGELSKEEAEYFRSMPEKIKKDILIHSKGR